MEATRAIELPTTIGPRWFPQVWAGAPFNLYVTLNAGYIAARCPAGFATPEQAHAEARRFKGID